MNNSLNIQLVDKDLDKDHHTEVYFKEQKQKNLMKYYSERGKYITISLYVDMFNYIRE